MRIINLSNILPQKQPSLRGWLIRSKLRSQSTDKIDHDQSTSKTYRTSTIKGQEQTRKKWVKALQVAILPGGIDLCDPPRSFFR